MGNYVFSSTVIRFLCKYLFINIALGLKLRKARELLQVYLLPLALNIIFCFYMIKNRFSPTRNIGENSDWDLFGSISNFF